MTRIALFTLFVPIAMLMPPPGLIPGPPPTRDCDGCPGIVVVEPGDHRTGDDCGQRTF